MKSTKAPASVSSKPKEPKEPKEKAPKEPKEKAPKAEAPKTEAPKVEVKAAEPVVASAVAEEVKVDALAVQTSELLSNLSKIVNTIVSLKNEAKTLFKQYERDIKAAQKASSKHKRKAGTRAPSGFVVPTKISSELAEFLGKPAGTEIARTEVTKELNAYIKKNGLSDKANGNGRQINADAKLIKLLKLTPDSEKLTYFNLQHYLSPHFAKKGVPVV